MCARILLLLGGSLAPLGALSGAAEGSCPANGPGSAECAAVSAISEEDLQCVRWRQTGGCNPDGPREKHGDKACSVEIPTGSSGYCQCGNVKKGTTRKVRLVTCDHRPFNCATECLQMKRYMCIGWRQTGNCDADGPREPDKDAPCDASIDATMSGYCECGEERRVRQPGCKHGEFMEPFTCKEVCAAEADLYEELGLASGASEKDIKQAFRKMSLKYHPDKTRGNVALTARFTQIREAYDILSNQEQRALYDAAGLKMVFEARNQKVEKGPAMQGEMQVTLEGMYNGADLQTHIHRKVICRGCAERYTDRCKKCTAGCAHEFEMRNVQFGPMVMQQKVQVPSRQKCRTAEARLDVTIERGTSPGDTVIFKSMGEQQPGHIPGDVVLTIRETKHEMFKRVGVDLQMEVELTLKEALLGWERTVTQLDGRKITFGYDGVTRPFGIMKVEGEGMPHKGDPTQKGNLIIKCIIKMPEDGREWLKSMALE